MNNKEPGHCIALREKDAKVPDFCAHYLSFLRIVMGIQG